MNGIFWEATLRTILAHFTRTWWTPVAYFAAVALIAVLVALPKTRLPIRFVIGALAMLFCLVFGRRKADEGPRV